MKRNSSFKKTKELVLFLNVILVSTMLTSCGIYRGNVLKFYPGSPLPNDQIALLIPTSSVGIEKINGRGYNKRFSIVTPYTNGAVELIPGHYIISTILSTGYVHSVEAVNIELDAKPGHVYEVYSVLGYSSKTWSPMIRDVTDQKDAKYAKWVKSFMDIRQEYPSSPTLLLLENFDNNERGWTVHDSSDHISYLSGGEYIIEGKNDNSHVEEIRFPLDTLKNFDIELVSVWKSGVNDYPYGLVIGSDENNLYYFYTTGNGCAIAFEILEGKTFMITDWQCNTSVKGNGTTANRQTIEVRDQRLSYYVNSEYIGTVLSITNLNKLTLSSSRMKFMVVGVIVTGKQKVAFDQLKISNLRVPSSGGLSP